jgi:hypothetical protein
VDSFQSFLGYYREDMSQKRSLILKSHRYLFHSVERTVPETRTDTVFVSFYYVSIVPILVPVMKRTAEMSSSSQSQPNPEENDGGLEKKARLKDMARESRFNFRNLAEHQLRRELKEEAMEICNPEIKKFAECSQEKGLMVVFSCQSLFREVNKCLQVHNGEAAWQNYKEKHADEIERRARVG